MPGGEGVELREWYTNASFHTYRARKCSQNVSNKCGSGCLHKFTYMCMYAFTITCSITSYLVFLWYKRCGVRGQESDHSAFESVYFFAEILGLDLTKLMIESAGLKVVGADRRSTVLVDVVGGDGNRVIIKLIRGAS